MAEKENENRPRRPRFRGMLTQVIILFAFGALVIGMFTYFTEQVITDSSVRKQTQNHADNIAQETYDAIREYPAYQWLIRYWQDHEKDLDIEYDAALSADSRTAAKERQLREHQPQLQMKYAEEAEIKALPAEDQKLYAEIVYSWIITRLDQIKQAYHVDFLFCLLTDDTFREQYFLLSAADPGAKRGTEYEEVYTLGVTTEVSEDQQQGMQQASKNREYLAAAGDYVDCYAYAERIGDQHLMIGLTFGLAELNADINGRTLKATVLAMLLELALAWICLVLIYRLVLQPVRGIQKNIRLYKDEKNSEEVRQNLAEFQPSNEIGTLSQDVSDLVTEIDDYMQRIKASAEERERIHTELTLARRIQDHMVPNTFPAFPERSEFDLYASMEPARGVGGDFYDYFLVDDDHLCLLIADVSGKGIPAALFMMASKIILMNNASLGKSPGEILKDSNDTICANNNEDMFVTVWLGVLELSTGTLKAANAGHEYPAIRKRDGRFGMLRDQHSLMVGAMDGIEFMEYEMQLEPGDRIFVYTDGIPEAVDPQEEAFGTSRMLRALNEPAEDPQQIVSNVREAVRGFVGDAEQFDDLTMLCLEYRGKSGR